jgi:hypothetical protein
MLGEPPQIVLRERGESTDAERRRVADFNAKWAKFDWTSRLKKNQPNTNTSNPTATSTTSTP